MAAFTVEELKITPEFELELFMSVSQETRIGGAIMNRLADTWDQWLPYARAHKISAGGRGYLLAWLDEPVEVAVDDMWEESPSDAYLFNALAQVMCMGVIHAQMPEVEDVGCAAFPALHDDLADALEAAGVPLLGGTALQRRYAVITNFPFLGGCEVCTLRAECPKGSGSTCASDGPLTVELPGHRNSFD